MTKKCLVICPNPAIDIQAEITGFIPGEPTRIVSESKYPGGKGIHVAMALAELGVPCELMGIWGEANGSHIIRDMNKYYPDILNSGPVVAGWNRSCYSFISNNEWKDTELLGTGPTVSNEIVTTIINQINQKKETLVSVAICGSWPKGAPPSATSEVITYCHKIDLPVFVDASGPQLEHALQSKPYLIHLNRKEITDLYQLDFEASLEKISQHCKIAAITDGSKGLYYIEQAEKWHANVIVEQEIISTIGAGDCLTAGLIKAHYAQTTNEDAAKWGVACGAANCLRPELGMLHSQTVNALFAKVKTKSIDY